MDKLSFVSLFAVSLAANMAGCQDAPANNGTQPTPPPTPTVPGLGRPNVLFVISDDQSWPHTSAYGSTMVSTPGFDRIAAAGALFTNFYVTSPGSSPSRASMLTGLYPWQIEEAGTHASSFPAKYTCFPEVLQQAGYHIGYTGKGWGPGNWQVSGRKHNPAGPAYNGILLDPPYSGISKIDYTANFKKFLSERTTGQPFCFWVGTHEPHRAYQADSWTLAGRSLTQASIPGYLPGDDAVRGDMLNYAVEIEWFDNHLAKCIDELVRLGEFDNTIIIVTADNGMAFPRAKSNCYDPGIHVPLAICWGEKIQPSQVIDALTSGVDFFPTLMEAANLTRSGLSGQSLLPLMNGNPAAYTADAVFAGRERHSSARYDNLGYPIRSIRWKNYMLVWNPHPERWPAGDPQEMSASGTLKTMHKAYYDIDGSPSKTYLTNNYNDLSVKPYFEAAVAKRAEYELYDLADDPACMNDLSGKAAHQDILAAMQQKLNARLVETGDTRLGANPEIWETYPRLEGDMRYFPAPAHEENDDHLRAGWTLRAHPGLFVEAGNSLEGPLDGITGTFIGLVKPGRTHGIITNPPVGSGGYIEFIIDMKKPLTVNYFRIRHKNTGNVQLRWRKFSQISGSNDGENFTLIDTDVAVTDYDMSDKVMTPNVSFKEATYRYLKFYANTADCWDTANGNSVQMSEIYLGKAE